MDIEYEAKFANIDKDRIRKTLKAASAKLIKPEYLQRRMVFYLPEGHEIEGGWARVRDEADRVTMSLKIIDGESVEDQKEVQLVIDDFDAGKLLLETLGCRLKGYQENKRELWELEKVEITIDEWPFLEPYVEIEGHSEAAIKAVAEKLGFNYSEALFCATGILYEKKYGIPEMDVYEKNPRIVFDMENPFV
jgi:adenylate cyclase class 2